MLLKFPWNNPVVENAPLRPVSSAAGSHSVAARDHFEIESLLDVLSQPWPVSLEDNRVLEFSCGRIRIPFLIAAAGHQVLAVDTDPENLANMAERLVPSTPSRTDVAARVELRLADLRDFCFPEDFKAIHIPAAGLALFDAAEVLLVLGSTLTVMSGLRFARQAVKQGKDVIIASDGVTRADDLATLRIHGRLEHILPFWADALRAG